MKFTDWQEQPRSHRFAATIAFRWDDELDTSEIRDDACYIVEPSSWLQRQADLANEPAERFVHYKLCFNACGVLDVICRHAAG